jgi:archaellum biogenesis ATPase FlaH
MEQKILDQLKDLPNNFIVMLVVGSDNYEQANMSILNMLVNQQSCSGSYVTVNRPYKSMIELMKSSGIDHNKLFFIDCITKKVEEPKETKNCVFIDSPSNLTELGIALEEVFKQSKHKFLFLDSLNILAVYNSPERVIKFAHFLTSKMRMHDLKGVMISLHEDTDKKLIAELSQFCDKMIYL